MKKLIDGIMNGEKIIVERNLLIDVIDEINCLFGIELIVSIVDGEYVVSK